MSYYFRVFCTAESVPPLADVLKWVSERGVPASTEPAGATNWDASPLSIRYAENAPPFGVETQSR